MEEIYEAVIQQSTGLKDKNGKEIFEGDIIQLNNKNYEVLFGSYFTKSDVGHGVHLAESGNKNEFPKTICDLDFDYVIIGNIFQNSELLK